MVAFGAKQVWAVAGRIIGQDFSLAGFDDPAEVTLCGPAHGKSKKLSWNE
jgi:hypothetical protein